MFAIIGEASDTLENEDTERFLLLRTLYLITGRTMRHPIEFSLCIILILIKIIIYSFPTNISYVTDLDLV